MKQGMTRRLKPKPKQDTKTWQRRNAARLEKQEQHKARLIEETLNMEIEIEEATEALS